MALQCPKCGSRNVININLTVEGGRELSFYSCHACEKRWWSSDDGRPLDLPDVLEIARRPKGGSGASAS